MLVDLISVVNQEDLVLDGAFYAPAADAPSPGPVDSMLLIHGVAGQFLRPRHQVHGRRSERPGHRLPDP